MHSRVVICDKYPVDVVEPVQIDLLRAGRKRYPNKKTRFAPFNISIGIEIEVEQKFFHVLPMQLYWRATDDGSLKEKGIEFVSVPLVGENIDYALEEIFCLLEQDGWLWTHRAGIHVHVWVGGMSERKLAALVAVYAALERLFFFLAAEERRASAFCYPLLDISPHEYLLGEGDGKYAALNVTTSVQKYNTVEFRHKEATSSKEELIKWLLVLCRFRRYIERHSEEQIEKEVLSLNTTSHYQLFLDKVLGRSASLFCYLDLQKEMEPGVMWAKLFLRR